MAKPQKTERAIPPFKTEQEEADWWVKHGAAMEGVPSDIVISDDIGNIILVEFKLSSDEFRALCSEAEKSANGDFIALIRSWVQERTAELMEAR